MRCSFLSLPCYCRHAACRLLLLLLCPPATNKGGSPRQKVLGPAQMYVSVNGGWVGGWVGEWVGVWAAGRARMGGWVVRRRVYLEWLSNYNVSGEMCLPPWLFVGKKCIFLPVMYGLSFKSMLFTLYLCTIFLIWQQLIVTHCMSEYLKALYDVRHFDFSHKCSCSCRIGLKLQVFALKQASFVIGSFYLSVNLKWNEIIF